MLLYAPRYDWVRVHTFVARRLETRDMQSHVGSIAISVVGY